MRLELLVNLIACSLVVSSLWCLVCASSLFHSDNGSGIFKSETNVQLLSEYFNVETKLTRNGMLNLFGKDEKRGNMNSFLHENNPFLLNEPLLSSTLTLQRSVQQKNQFFNVVLKVKDINKFKMENSNLIIQPIAKNVISTIMSMDLIQSLLRKNYIEWIGQVDPIFKFDIQDFMENKQNNVELLVQFHSESGISKELKQMIENFKALFGVSLVRIENQNIMLLKVPRRYALGVSYEISKDSSVFWIEPKQEILLNNKFSKSIIGDGSEKIQRVNFGGLTGEGETVTVVDGSFDVNSCFFTDPNVPVTQFKTYEEGIKLTPQQVNSHRKIKAYYAFVDNRTRDSDHGSHVAGSIAGNSIYGSTVDGTLISDYNGVAPDSKLVLVQLGCQSPTCITENGDYYTSTPGSIFPPSDPTNFFSFSKDIANSKVQSNSWGGGSSYNGYASSLDKYIFNNKDMLVLFSAGNSGNKGFNTIGAQAHAKNIITVGASHNSFEARKIQYGNLTDSTSERVREYILASLKCRSTSTNFIAECKYFSNTNNTVDACDKTGYCAKGNNSMATGLCGCTLDSVGAVYCGECIYHYLDKKYLQPDGVADFSSRGPTRDGRIKPDIMAPGNSIISVRSFTTVDDGGKQCSQRKNLIDHIIGKSGTSMATPTLAGLSVLVRQYFRDGYYVDGVKNTKIGFNPSASLVKATMINSAVDLSVVSGDYELVEKLVPRSWNSTRYQGFGKVQIENVFQFGKNQRKLWIGRTEHIQNIAQLNVETEFGDPVLSNVEDEHIYYIAPTNANQPMKNVKITLVWSDYPSSPLSRLNIVNNLDLEVNLLQKVIYGNSQLFSQQNKVRDSLNNVEQVWVDNIDHGVVIRIYAEYLFVPQSYSLVVSGDNVSMHLLKE